jgi:hypothetical protein
MTMRRYEVDVVTAADGSATVFSPHLRGLIQQIEYVKDGTNGFADGVDFTITSEKTGNSILAKSDVNASAVFAPRQPTHTQAGVAALYASAGVAVNAPIAISADRIKIAIASGGNAKVGTFHILVG